MNVRDHEARAYPAIAWRSEDCPNPPTRRMGDKTFEDALGEFTLKEQGRPETGSLIGVWIEIGGRRAFFQPQEILVEKLYRPPQ